MSIKHFLKGSESLYIVVFTLSRNCDLSLINHGGFVRQLQFLQVKDGVRGDDFGKMLLDQKDEIFTNIGSNATAPWIINQITFLSSCLHCAVLHHVDQLLVIAGHVHSGLIKGGLSVKQFLA